MRSSSQLEETGAEYHVSMVVALSHVEHGALDRRLADARNAFE
jgi:hypothetical protein